MIPHREAETVVDLFRKWGIILSINSKSTRNTEMSNTTVVPAEIKTRVVKRIEHCIAVATAHYGRSFAMPEIRYDVKGRVAGYAYYKQYRVDFNAGLLLENIDDFIEQTCAHEVAHLITDVVYPEAHTRSRAAYSTRGKRQPHGPQWQEVMRVLGVEPKRCHNYDTTNVVRRKSTTREVKCQCCKKSYFIGQKRAKFLEANPTKLWCPVCGRQHGMLHFVQHQQPTETPAKAVVAKPVQRKQSDGQSKLSICMEIFAANRTASRAKLIERFIEDANCTAAGAATYFAKLKSMYC
jgi:SprT protein